MVTIEPVTGVAIAVLAVVFIGALASLVALCRHKYCKPIDFISRQHQVNNPDQQLVDHMEVEEHPAAGVELVGVVGDGASGRASALRALEDQEWVEDATGLAPHCLAILRTCHTLSERLVGMTMNNSGGRNNQQLCSPETITDLVATAKRIGPRVDEVVRALYPPLDPRLLEARCTALVLSVSHLVLITKAACRLSGVLDWIDQSLADVEDHLRVLREASVNYDQNLALAAAANQDGGVAGVPVGVVPGPPCVNNAPIQQPDLHAGMNPILGGGAPVESPPLFVSVSNQSSPQHQGGGVGREVGGGLHISPRNMSDEARL